MIENDVQDTVHVKHEVMGGLLIFEPSRKVLDFKSALLPKALST